MMENKDIIDFIGGDTNFDDFGGTYIWGKCPKGGDQMIGEVRGWGAIQNKFKNKDGSIDFDKARKFQDRMGNFISNAINEKIKREKVKSNPEEYINIPEWKVKTIKNALRLAKRINNCESKETAFDREVLRAWKHINDEYPDEM